MSIGIDKIGFATSQYVLNMADLALARGAEPEKFSKGLMLDATSITPVSYTHLDVYKRQTLYGQTRHELLQCQEPCY